MRDDERADLMRLLAMRPDMMTQADLSELKRLSEMRGKQHHSRREYADAAALGDAITKRKEQMRYFARRDKLRKLGRWYGQ